MNKNNLLTKLSCTLVVASPLLLAGCMTDGGMYDNSNAPRAYTYSKPVAKKPTFQQAKKKRNAAANSASATTSNANTGTTQGTTTRVSPSTNSAPMDGPGAPNMAPSVSAGQ